MAEEELSTLKRVLAERAAAAANKEHVAAAREYAGHLIPDTQFERTAENSQLDALLDGVSIIDAYIKWCGKMKPQTRHGQTEGVKISCPIPGHADHNPSAWINTDKGTWFCGACNLGGDKFDLAAYGLNYPVPGYKQGDKFPELRKAMARDLGFVVQELPNRELNVYRPEPAPAPKAEPEPASPPERKLASVTSITPAVDEQTAEVIAALDSEISEFLAPTFSWRELVTPDTFLDKYMQACIVDTSPEEYHFWNALILIGLAVGRDVVLDDTFPVMGNLMVCLIGQTGVGKSSSLRSMKDVLKEALPYDRTNPMSKGVLIQQGIASGEQLISSFDVDIPNPVNPKLYTGEKASVRGLVEYAELASLVARCMRAGATLKQTVMDFADAASDISSISRTSGTVEARNAFASVWTSTQPESMRNLVKEDDNTSGFLNRWLFITGKAKKAVALNEARIDIAPAIMPLKKIHADPKRVITWSDTAADLWTAHFDAKVNPARLRNPILSRIDLLEKKLILLFTVNERLNEVPVSVVQKVIALHDYIEAVFLTTAEVSKPRSINTEIYNEIIRHIERLTSDPKNKSYGPNKKSIKDRIKHKQWDPLIVERIFDLLEKDDRIEISQGDPAKPGRKTSHYKWLAG